MAVFRWYCNYERGWGQDFEKCGAESRKWSRSLRNVTNARIKHESNTGHSTSMQTIDGRKVRGQIR